VTLDARDDLFSRADLEQLSRRGLTLEEAYRQVALLSRPPGFAALDRHCAVGDGIELVDEREAARLGDLARAAAAAGRCMAFVPASGAASRMFKDLLGALARPVGAPGAEADATRSFLEGLSGFAFAGDLAAALARAGQDASALLARGDARTVLSTLLEPAGLGYADCPKALLPFHRYGEERRTAFEEHLVEAAVLVSDAGGRCRAHFTVSAEHMDRFLALLELARPRLEARHGVSYEVEFSVQKPSTDTLALDPGGQPFHGADGSLLFRPAGHGALIANLAELGGDIVFIKNIDNVAVDPLKPATTAWSRVLIGRLAETQAAIFTLLARLEDPRDRAAADEALAFASAALHREPPRAAAPASPDSRRAAAVGLLARPLRVCGMVPNTGEPGGGPFWVRGRDRVLSLQLVETAQIDPAAEAQRSLHARSTHFNPVFMACALRDHRGGPFDLTRFVDPDAVIVTRKSHAGRELLNLERPGLWNGAMAGWNTLFVEVPLAVFNPVKTVNDLLRPEHQAAG